MIRRVTLTLVVLALVVLGWRSLFQVDETQVAVLTRFDQIEGAYGPGLHAKSPLEQVRFLDRRLLTRLFPGERFLTADHRVLNLDFLIKWRLEDAGRYLRATHGDEDVAAERLAELARVQIKDAVAQLPPAAVTLDPGGSASLTAMNLVAAQFGVRVVDLQLQRIDPGEDAARAAYERMQQSLVSQTQQMRTEAVTEASKIRSDAERQRADLLAGATRDAQRIRGEADAKAAAAYAQAYARNGEFAGFYRSLQAYKETLGQAGDVLVISPEGEFFKYLHSAAGR